VLFRALQGAVAGPMIPTTQALMLSIYPPHRRGFALSMIAMVTVVAPIAGPLLGGWITDSYSWPWTFLINVPIGLFAAATVHAQMRAKPEKTEVVRVDHIGLATLVLGVGALQIVLDKGNDEDWFQSPFIVVMALVAALSLAVFVIWELHERNPIVNLRLFANRNFAAGTVTLVLAYSAFFAVNVIVPQWLQRTLGYTAIWAGLAAAPMGLLPVLMTPFMGKYAPRFNMRWMVCSAFAILGAASFIRSGFFLGVDFAHVAAVQLLQGLGLGWRLQADRAGLGLVDALDHGLLAGKALAGIKRPRLLQLSLGRIDLALLELHLGEPEMRQRILGMLAQHAVELLLGLRPALGAHVGSDVLLGPGLGQARRAQQDGRKHPGVATGCSLHLHSSSNSAPGSRMPPLGRGPDPSLPGHPCRRPPDLALTQNPAGDSPPQCRHGQEVPPPAGPAAARVLGLRPVLPQREHALRQWFGAHAASQRTLRRGLGSGPAAPDGRLGAAGAAARPGARRLRHSPSGRSAYAVARRAMAWPACCEVA